MAPISLQGISSLGKRDGGQTKVNTTMFGIVYGLLGMIFLAIVLMFSIHFGKRLSNRRVDRRKRSALIMAAAFRSPKVKIMEKFEIDSAASNNSQPMKIRQQSRGGNLPAFPFPSFAPSRLRSPAIPALASPSSSSPDCGDSSKSDAPSLGSHIPGSDLTETQGSSSTEAAAPTSISEAADEGNREIKAKASRMDTRQSRRTYERYAAPTPFPTIFEDETYQG